MTREHVTASGGKGGGGVKEVLPKEVARGGAPRPSGAPSQGAGEGEEGRRRVWPPAGSFLSAP